METTDSIAIPSTTTNADREGVTFTQFAKRRGYAIPDGCNVSGASVKDADALLAFAGELGGYIWDSKKRKFYKTEIVG